jgi:hypothetical protein
MSISRIRKTIPYRSMAEHIDKNFQILKSINDRVAHLEASHGQLWSGCMSEGAPGSLYSGAGDRFRRNIPLGNSTGSFVDWQPVSVAAGYDIWKYTPDDYGHDPTNVLFLDDQALIYRGLATAEQLTSFDKVYEDDNGVATDVTTEAASRYGTGFQCLGATDDYIYIGHASTFGALTVYMQIFAIGLSLELEYWNGSAWAVISDTVVTDDTNAFQRDGKLSWDVPSDWATTAYQTVTAYWLRISTTAAPTQSPTFYSIVPAESVLSLLYVDQLAASRGDYPWCTYDDSLYVAMRNTGNPDYEGIKFIRSGSSDNSLYSFFVDKHEFKVSYELASWTGGGIALAQRIRDLE